MVKSEDPETFHAIFRISTKFILLLFHCMIQCNDNLHQIHSINT